MSKADVLRFSDYLEHIAEAIARIGRYVRAMDETSFVADEKTCDAVVRNFEIIGEAARNMERYMLHLLPASPSATTTFDSAASLA